MTDDHTPIVAVITHCPVCGLTDHDRVLGRIHFRDGFICPGIPERHEYRLTQIPDHAYPGDF